MLHLLCVAVILLLLLPLVPESPRYLLVKGKTEQAQQVLRKVSASWPVTGCGPLLSCC
jgi:hypothetical protein